MEQTLVEKEIVNEMIASGQPLLLAAEEEVLAQLPAGNWIAGTIPYFMTKEGGKITKDKIFVSQLPEYATKYKIQEYTADTIKNVYSDAPENGFSVIIIPASSPIHLRFALEAPDYLNFAITPLIGWISGIHLDNLGSQKPLVVNGLTTTSSDSSAVVMHVELPVGKYAEIKILNIFAEGSGDTISFLGDGFQVTDAIINGETRNFAAYIKEKELDTRLPLVANYSGAKINISFQSVNDDGTVDFYAPVFKNMEYKHAQSIENYVLSFISQMPTEDLDNIAFSCNCILNFLYSELEGKKTGGVVGPITFGEVAYQLLNQTLAYLTITDV